MCRDHDQTLNDSLGAVIAELGVFASEVRREIDNLPRPLPRVSSPPSMIYRKIALAAAAFALIGETDALGVGIRAAPSVLMRPIDVRAAKHEPGAHAFLFLL